MTISTLLAIALATTTPATQEPDRAVHVRPLLAAGLSGAVVLPALATGLVILGPVPNDSLGVLMPATLVTMCFVGAGQMLDGEFERGGWITFGSLFVPPAGVLVGFALTPLLPPLGSTVHGPGRTAMSSFGLGLGVAALGLAAYGTWSAVDAYALGIKREEAKPGLGLPAPSP